MGCNSELVLKLEQATDLPKALGMVSTWLIAGNISQAEAHGLSAEANRLHNPTMQGPGIVPRAIPVPKVWAPEKAAAAGVQGDLLTKVWIDPETGRAHYLTPEAAEEARLDSAEEGDRRQADSDRFPSGKAIMLGVTADGDIVCKRYVVGLACSDPYSASAGDAYKLVKAGGQAIYGRRDQGYKLTITKGKGGKYASSDLKPSSAVKGTDGPKGLSLVDARTNYQVPLAERLVWLLASQVLDGQDCSPEQCAEAIKPFWPNVKVSKAELKAAFDVANVRAQGVAFSERHTPEEALDDPYKLINEHGVVTTRPIVESTDRKVRSNALSVWRWRAKSGSQLDCALPADNTGIPFTMHFGSGIVRTEYENVKEEYAEDQNTGDIVWPPTRLAHAMALRTAGPMCVSRVSWKDTLGEHTVTRADALRALPIEDEVDEVRATYNPDEPHEAYMGRVLEAMSPELTEGLDLGGMSVLEDSEFMTEHRAAVAQRKAADETVGSESKKHEREAEKHDRNMVKIVRAKVGKYDGPTTVTRSLSKGYRAHKNHQSVRVRPKSNGRAIKAKLSS
jgi:hypothetical protein